MRATVGGAGRIVGCGVDVVDVDRMGRVIARRPRFVQRCFTEAERAEAVDHPARLAARFAAKEAVMKALGVGLGAVRMTDIETVRGPGGAPRVTLRAAAAELARRRGVHRWHVSLSHDGPVAVAFVIAEGHGEAAPPEPGARG